MFDTLMAYDSRTGAFQPRLADSLEPNEDFTTWTLRLREGVRFGNGDPLDAAAVVASINRHLEDDALNRSLAEMIALSSVVDDRTVTFELSQSWSGFPFALAGPIGMITNPRVVEERGDDFQSNPQGAGVGPFELERYAEGEELVLRAKQDYWAGDVCVGTLRFRTISDARTAYDAFSNGEVDVAFVQDPLVVSQARDAGVNNFGFKYGMGRTIAINAGKRGTTPPTTDVRVRRAIALALDPEFINDRATQGGGNPTSAIFSEDMNSWSGVDGPENDPDAARELVETVKSEGKWDGTIRLICPQISEDAGIAIEALLTDVGFNVQRETVDTSTLVEKVIRNVDFDLACWQFNISDFEPWVSMEAFRSDSSSNRGGYSNPEMDAAIDELRVAKDAETRKQILAKIQRLWNETVPSANFATNEDVILWQDRVDGLNFSSESLVFFDDAIVKES
ncbi:MAG TPA: ABC transporter substrate-binding protein [Acidimicrobiales bacterium]